MRHVLLWTTKEKRKSNGIRSVSPGKVPVAGRDFFSGATTVNYKKKFETTVNYKSFKETTVNYKLVFRGEM